MSLFQPESAHTSYNGKELGFPKPEFDAYITCVKPIRTRLIVQCNCQQVSLERLWCVFECSFDHFRDILYQEISISEMNLLSRISNVTREFGKFCKRESDVPH